MKILAAALLAIPLLLAQESTTIAVSNGVEIELSSDFGHPTGEEKITVEMARATGNSFYRIFWDQNHLAVFAYELAVDLGPGGDALLVTAKPAEDAFAQRYANADAGKPVPSLSSDHDLGPLNSGRSATLGLFEIPGVGLAVSETVRVHLNQSGGAKGALHFAGIRVFVDKTQVSGPVPRVAVAGTFAMFYIPGSGGYFFSTEPVANRAFINAGSIDHSHMDFTIDNQTFHVTADAPIVADSSGLWVFHDPAYKPTAHWTVDMQNAASTPSAADEFFVAASDTLTWWFQ